MAFDYTSKIDIENQIKSLLRTVNNIDLRKKKYAIKKINLIKKQINNLSFMVSKHSLSKLDSLLLNYEPF